MSWVWNGDRASVGGLEEAVGGEHKEARLSLEPPQKAERELPSGRRRSRR